MGLLRRVTMPDNISSDYEEVYDGITCESNEYFDDHYWHLVPGDPSTGLEDYEQCYRCGKIRELTSQSYYDHTDFYLED